MNTNSNDISRHSVRVTAGNAESPESHYALEELVTRSLAEYETLAVELALDRRRLSAIRAHLTGERERLPLFDTPRFCRHLERAYRRMWQRHRDGEPAASFRVEPVATPGSTS